MQGIAYAYEMISLDEYMVELGMRIRELRLKSGMSLRTCGLMLGIHHNQLQKIEQGKANPTLATICKIASGFDVDVRDLLSNLNEPPSNGNDSAR